MQNLEEADLRSFLGKVEEFLGPLAIFDYRFRRYVENDSWLTLIESHNSDHGKGDLGGTWREPYCNLHWRSSDGIEVG